MAKDRISEAVLPVWSGAIYLSVPRTSGLWNKNNKVTYAVGLYKKLMS